MKPYIVLFSGARIEPDDGVATMHDIALNHCRTPMYAGHTRLFQSVAHHCVGAARLARYFDARAEVALFTLLHEVEVTVFGDVPGPVKCVGQRAAEKPVRERFWLQLAGRVPSVEDWERVELFDKIEQYAAAQFYGLKETVHARTVENIIGGSQSIINKAMEIVREVNVDFPPMMQLGIESRLVLEFMSYATELFNQANREAGIA